MADLVLSVIVPAHNAGVTLADCLDALVASDLARENWELIVVDDGSTDDTAAIAKRIANKVLTAGLIAKGPAFARNRGAAAADSPILFFVDADVAVHPDAFRLTLEALAPTSPFAAVFGSYDDSPGDRSTISQYRNLLHHYVHQKNAGETSTFWAGCGAIRTEAFIQSGGFDEARYPRPQIEDIELGYRLRAAGGRILIDPRVQCTHHKSWRLVSMMRTDLRDRAIPWVRLLLSSPPRAVTPTPSLGNREVVGSVMVASAIVFAASTAARFNLLTLAATIICIAISIWINRELYLWFAQKRGAAFSARVVPLHLAYQALSAVAVPFGAAFHVAHKLKASVNSTEVSDRSTITRFAHLAGGEAGSRLISFAATAYLARTLGATGFGQIAFAAAVVAQFGTALAAGVSEVGSREVARQPARIRRIAASGSVARLIGALAAIAMVVLLAFVLPIEPTMRKVTILSALFLIPLALDTSWVYKGTGETRKVGVALFLAQISSLALILILVRGAGDVARVPVVQAAGDFVAAAFLGFTLLKGRWKIPDRRSLLELPAKSGMITISRSLRTIIVSFDVILLGLMVASSEVGLYSAAYRIVFFVMAVMYASHVAFLPDMMRSGSDVSRLSPILSRAIELSLSAVMPFVAGGVLIAPALLSAVFGRAYRDGAVPLQLLLVSVLLISIHGTTRNVFLATGKMGLETTIVAVGVAVNIILNLILIPRAGITGAAIATVIGEAVILVLAVFSVLKLGVRPRISRALLSPIIAGVVLMLVIIALGVNKPVAELIAAGAIAYGIVLTLVRILSRRITDSSYAAAGA